VQSDILEYCQKLNTATTSSSSSFDGVILNACFGNFWDPRQVLEAVPGRTICISHPLGASFIQELHSKDPKTVPHLLPETTMQVLNWTHGLPLVLLSDLATMTPTPYYLTTLQKCRAKGLPQIHRYRGVVDQGYGRGGKKLGVPTANLPASLFQNALEDVATGVYFGWTALETNNDQPDITNSGVYKAVVNVGYSPTFEGQENPEKIIEAHLILDDDDEPLQDFYGVPMRLQLIGFLRDEKKFDSFPELIAQINADVRDAKDTLDWTPYQQLKDDDFLKTWSSSTSSWIGSGGGDENASWEFAPMMEALQTVFKKE
jgi:riboflavin kinase